LADILLLLGDGLNSSVLFFFLNTGVKAHFSRRGWALHDLKENNISSPIQNYLQSLHNKYAQLREGAVASYIPELSTANPDWFGICIATTDGHVYEVGDTRHPFTIQSISKPLVYGLALEDCERGMVLKKIGVEPTGDAFNSISLAPGTGCPLNPMINAGAIAATSLIAGRSDEDKLNRILSVISLYAGRQLTIDRLVYESEKTTGHRNRAIGHMLRNFNILADDPDPILDLYFQQCSICIDCRDLSIMAASLANGGVNPVTGERAVRSELIEDILSVMTTCGMYDYVGEWVYRVGMPAKSGVAGGILAVLPGQLGIGIFSPPLDARGNSTRGVKVCEEISRDLNLHFLHPPRSSVSVLHSQYSLQTVRSKRRRTESEKQILDAYGNTVNVYELQGDLRFSTVEVVVRKIIRASATLMFAIIDLKRVTHIDLTASRILAELVRTFAAHGKHLLFSRLQSHPRFRRFLEEMASLDAQTRVTTFAELDLALEWCETKLIAQYKVGSAPRELVPLSQHQLCQGLQETDVAYLASLMDRECFNTADLIIRKGEAAQKLYFLVRGEVSVIVEVANGQQKRLATILPGMGFGESAIIDGGVRTADIRADHPVECYSLTKEAFESLDVTHTKLKIGLLQNLLVIVTERMNRLTEEVRTLEG
jgi:glutaminase